MAEPAIAARSARWGIEVAFEVRTGSVETLEALSERLNPTEVANPKSATELELLEVDEVQNRLNAAEACVKDGRKFVG